MIRYVEEFRKTKASSQDSPRYTLERLRRKRNMLNCSVEVKVNVGTIAINVHDDRERHPYNIMNINKKSIRVT